MELRDQSRRHACRLIAWRWPIGHMSQQLDDLLRRALSGERGESGCLIPRIDTRSRKRRKHRQMQSACIVGNRAEQEFVQIGSQELGHRDSVSPMRARRYRDKVPSSEYGRLSYTDFRVSDERGQIAPWFAAGRGGPPRRHVPR